MYETKSSGRRNKLEILGKIIDLNEKDVENSKNRDSKEGLKKISKKKKKTSKKTTIRKNKNLNSNIVEL